MRRVSIIKRIVIKCHRVVVVRQPEMNCRIIPINRLIYYSGNESTRMCILMFQRDSQVCLKTPRAPPFISLHKASGFQVPEVLE